MSDDITIDSEEIVDEEELDLLQSEIDESESSIDELRFPHRLPFSPRRITASGLYKATSQPVRLPARSKFSEDSTDEFEDQVGYNPGKILPRWLTQEEIRLDVDARYPQMQASGVVRTSLFVTVHWIARLRSTRYPDTWIGYIWFKNGPSNVMRHTRVLIKVKRSWFPHQRRLLAKFYGGGAPARVRSFNYRSPYFHPVEFEYDRVSDVPQQDATTEINTCAHPNRPATIRCENLSLETVYRRAGFNVRKSGDDGVIPVDDAGVNQTWSDAEMHDAMQEYWSRFANRAQWSMWVLFARLHDRGNSLGGVMFDDIGPNHRQGTAIFSDSFISQAPAGDASPQAWVDRMRFWTAAHEMGHGFNLAHSWQKSLGDPYGSPWLPTLSDEPEARSFMNYPYNVSGGESSFFSDFEYRFSDSELVFMRHAPASFVQMGNADWFDHHGFEEVTKDQSSAFKLTLRTNKPRSVFEFLEMINLELKLTNVSGQTRLVDSNVLKEYENMVIVIKKHNAPSRQWLPFAHYCRDHSMSAIDHGQSVYDSVLLSVGKNGWDISEPGNYTVQAIMTIEDEIVISNALKLRVEMPLTKEEEICAQDLFEKEVGQVLTYGGSRFLSTANNALAQVVERVPDSSAARQAKIVLAMPGIRKYKSLEISTSASDLYTALQNEEAKICVKDPDSSASKTLGAMLVEEGDAAAETMGHIVFKRYVDTYSHFLAQDDENLATEAQQSCQEILSARGVPGWVFVNDKYIAASTPAKKRKRATSKA